MTNKLDRQLDKILWDDGLTNPTGKAKILSQIKQSILKAIVEEMDKQEYIYDFKKFIKDLLQTKTNETN